MRKTAAYVKKKKKKEENGVRDKVATSVLCHPLLVRICPSTLNIEQQHPKRKDYGDQNNLHYQSLNIREVITVSPAPSVDWHPSAAEQTQTSHLFETGSK